MRPPASKSSSSASRPARWKVDDDLSYLLARASHVTSTAMHLEVRAAGLTVLEWRVLATLADGRAANVSQLASMALAEQSTVTKLLGRLEAHGSIARSAVDHDRRQSLVRITASGRKLVGPLLRRARRHARHCIDGLGPREADLLKRALRQLIDAR